MLKILKTWYRRQRLDRRELALRARLIELDEFRRQLDAEERRAHLALEAVRSEQVFGASGPRAVINLECGRVGGDRPALVLGRWVDGRFVVERVKEV